MERTGTRIDKAMEYYIQGFRMHGLLTKRTNREARRMLKEAIRLRDDFARAYAHLSYTLLIAWMNDWKEAGAEVDADVTLDQVLHYAQMAVDLDNDDYDVRWSLAHAYIFRRDFERGLDEFATALRLAERQAIPLNYSGLLVDRADVLFFAGTPGLESIRQAIADASEGMKGLANYTKRYFWTLGWAHYEAGYYEAERENCLLSLNALLQFRNPHDLIRKNIIANYVALGLVEPAARMAEEFLGRNPEYTLAAEDKWPYRDENRRRRWKRHLKQAGLPGDVEAPVQGSTG